MRRYVIALGLSLAVFALGACGSSSKDKPPTSESPYTVPMPAIGS